MIFSCTKKVLDKVKKYHPVENEKLEIDFYNWYVDLINIERKNYFLFTHSTSLFSFFLYAGTKKELTNLSQLFAEKLQELIVREIGTSEAYLTEMFPKSEETRFVKTNSRHLLGAMNEFKNQIKVQIWHKGPLQETHHLIHHYMNTGLVGQSGKYIKPSQLLKQQLQERLA